MRANDKLIVAVIGALLVVGAVWLLLVSPERSHANALSAQIATEQSTLASAQASLASARIAVDGYPNDVRELAQVTTAVPTSVDEPSVITTITKLAGPDTKVNVKTIDIGGAGGTAQGPSSLGLTFSFGASYASLQSFLSALDNLLVTDGTSFRAGGRLFTVAGVSLTPTSTGSASASVTASAYYQTPGSPSGATGATSTAAVTP